MTLTRRAFGRPDREVDAVGALVVHRVRAHLVEEPEVAALADVVVVHRAEHRPEGIGVGHPPLAAGVARPVLERLALLRVPAGPRRSRRRAGARARRADLPSRVKASSSARAVDEGAGDQRGARLLRAEHRERIAVRARDDRLDRAGMSSRRPAPRVGLPLRRLLGHRRPPPGVRSLTASLELIPQMSSRILPDRPVRREPAHPRGVEDRLLPPGRRDRTRARRPRAGRRHRRRSRSRP